MSETSQRSACSSLRVSPCFCSVEKTCKSQITLDVIVVENGSPFPDVV